MRKLKIIEHISLDGVIQAPGGPNEDGDYPYGGWTLPYRDPAAGKAVLAAHSEPFDLLLGRRTYDIWSGFWPKAPSSPLADSLNAATKYVATHRPDSLEWVRSRALARTSSRTFAASRRFVYPILLGKGKRFFSDGTPPSGLALTSTNAVSSGVLISTYTPAGPLRAGSYADPA